MEMNSSSNMNGYSAGRQHQRHHSSLLHRGESTIIAPGGRKSHGRAKSESQVPSSGNNLPPPANDGEVNLRHYFATLGLPVGSLAAISRVYNSMESRIWLLDNSLRMIEKDSQLISVDGNFHRIAKEDGASRWSELQQCVDFHMKMAARCWIPTKFWMVNKPNECDMPQRFGICWGDSADWPEERENATQIMNEIVPEEEWNPMANEVRKVCARLEPVATPLLEKGKFVSVIICTQGIPTNEDGQKGSAVLKDYLEALAQLASLPVKLVFRICSNDDGVLEFYKAVDLKIHCDVLDDYWSEAAEIYLMNPWLTYGIGIHRIREAGLGTELMDLLDERPFTLEQIRQWCMEFFVGHNHIFIRHPTLDWDGFIEDLQELLKREKHVWNPVKNKLCEWIDVVKLVSMHQRYARSTHRSHLRKNDFMSRRNTPDPPESPQDSVSPPQRRHHKFSSSMREVKHPSSVYRGKNQQFSASMYALPVSGTPSSGSHRRTTFSGQENSPATFHKQNSSKASQNEPLDLQQLIKNWSHKGPNQLRPLATLLVDVPTLFPPINLFVEPHDYFGKWRDFSKDAFDGESGEELNDLLQRAARKAKFFLHPDKLPKDLTPNQALVLKSIWDVVQESEEATFN